MKIELKDGTMIHVDSAEELAQALKVIGGEPKSERKSLDLEAQRADEGQRVRAVFLSINPNARKFMAHLLTNRKGIKGERFVELSGFSSDKFGGIMGGVKKCAENQELRRDQFIISEQKVEGTERLRILAPGQMLLKYEFDFRKILAQKAEAEILSEVSVGA
jgi:hypothetical protein